MSRKLGPDAARLWIAAGGDAVSRPFHLRWLLPTINGQQIGRWWATWGIGWAMVVIGMASWRWAAGDPWQLVIGATVLLVALPGILGPQVSIPVQVDLPATGWALVGVALLEVGWWPLALTCFAIAASIRETTPIWAALWAWSPVPLVAFAVVAVAAVIRKSGADPLGGEFQRIADHPVHTALEYHRGRWRDGWLMVAPWGLGLAGLVGADARLALVLLAAYAQLLVATDTVRLVQHAASPAVAVAAVAVIPVEWLWLALVLHVAWFWKPERV